MAIKHITEPVPRILEANPNLPNWMEKVIATAMAKDKDDRFSSAVELVETIKAFLRGEAIPAGKTQATVRISPFNKTAVVKKKSRSPVAMILFGVLFLVALVAGGGFFLFRNLPASEPEATVVPTFTASAPLETSAPIAVHTAEPTSATEAETEEATAPPAPKFPVIGGADKIAFLRNNDIWVMNVDGSDAVPVTNDGAAKFNLQWLNDGKTLLYMSGKTVKTVDIETLREENIFNYISAEYFESFRVSPDGTQAALTINRELFVIPFDRQALAGISRKSQLLDLNGCIFYDELAVKGALWSDDGKRLAIKYLAPSGNLRVDTIRIIDIGRVTPHP
jgi:hypothetical protein